MTLPGTITDTSLFMLMAPPPQLLVMPHAHTKLLVLALAGWAGTEGLTQEL